MSNNKNLNINALSNNDQQNLKDQLLQPNQITDNALLTYEQIDEKQLLRLFNIYSSSDSQLCNEGMEVILLLYEKFLNNDKIFFWKNFHVLNSIPINLKDNFEILIIPMLYNNHWTLAIVELINNKIFFYDSLGSNYNEQLKLLLNTLTQHFVNKTFSINFKQCPKQKDAFMCWFFVILNIYSYFLNITFDLNIHHLNLREAICNSIKYKNLTPLYIFCILNKTTDNCKFF